MNSQDRRASSVQIVIASEESSSRVRVLGALRSDPSLTVVGEGSDEASLCALGRCLQPDILILDSALASRINGAASLWSSVRIILLAGTIDEELVLQALRLAARGIVLKTSPPQVLVNSIRAILSGEYWLGGDSITILLDMLRHLLIEPAVAHRYGGLTERELRVVSMIAAGFSNRTISQRLDISERTVKHHLTKIFSKLGLSSRLQLANFAVTHRLVGNTDSAGNGAAGF